MISYALHLVFRLNLQILSTNQLKFHNRKMRVMYYIEVLLRCQSFQGHNGEAILLNRLSTYCAYYGEAVVIEAET